MEAKVSLDKVIAIASEVKTNLDELCELFNHLPGLIDKEHQLISTSDLLEIEKVTQEKNYLVLQMEKNCQAIKQSSLLLIEIHQRLYPTTSYTIGNISECIFLIHEITKAFRNKGVATQVLDHVIKGIEKVHKSFSETKTKYQAKIEMNKYLAQKLLNHHQESYRFWQDVASEMMATYSKDGIQKQQNLGPIISVKA